MPGNIKRDTRKDGELRQSVVMRTFQWQIGLVHQPDASSEVMFTWFLRSFMFFTYFYLFIFFWGGVREVISHVMALKPLIVFFVACLLSLKVILGIFCSSKEEK